MLTTRCPPLCTSIFPSIHEPLPLIWVLLEDDGPVTQMQSLRGEGSGR